MHLATSSNKLPKSLHKLFQAEYMMLYAFVYFFTDNIDRTCDIVTQAFLTTEQVKRAHTQHGSDKTHLYLHAYQEIVKRQFDGKYVRLTPKDEISRNLTFMSSEDIHQITSGAIHPDHVYAYLRTKDTFCAAVFLLFFLGECTDHQIATIVEADTTVVHNTLGYVVGKLERL